MNFLTCLLLAAIGQAPPAESFPFFEPVQPPRSLQVIAHRGGLGLVPEDTALALEASIADTVEWVEVDVRLTRDGHHVLFHDEALDGQTGATGRIRDRTLAEVREADLGSRFARRFAGRRVLTLAEGLELARGRVNLSLVCKDTDPARLAREVIQAKMGRQVVVSGEPEVLRAVRAEAGDSVAVMGKWWPRVGVDRWVEEARPRPQVVEIDAQNLTSETSREFQRRGIKVQAKALGGDDRPEVWDRLAAAGVDWIETDHAEEILARRASRAIGRGRVKVAHHRGASRYAPENTLEALRKSVALGADFVECDIRTTRDGAFVLLHDGSLDRTTSGRGPVRGRTAAEVSELDAGSWFGRPFSGVRVPTFEAFLDAVKLLHVELYLDAKDITPEALAEAVARHGLTDRSVVYQGAGYLERLKTIAPGLRRMPPLRDPAELEALADRVQPYAVDTRWTILSKPLIDRCHSLGIQVFSDALGSHESVEDYRRAARDGIDLIQTDRPVLVLRALELLERPTPPLP